MENEVQEIDAMVEDNYYCFRLYGETDIPEAGIFSVISGTEGTDTMMLFGQKHGAFDTSKVYTRMRFSSPIRVRSEFRFEYIEPDRNKAADSLTTREKNLLGQYDRYIRWNDVPLIDTVYLHQEIDLRNERLGDDVLLGIEMTIPETGTLVHSYFPFDTEGATPIGEIRRELYDNFAFLQTVNCRYRLFRHQSVLANFNWWVGSVSVLLGLLLIGIVVYFFRSTQQQKRLAEMKNELLANITHEFNTPVTNIALALKSIKPSDPKSERGVRVIAEENDRIRHNIENLLSFSSFSNDSKDIAHSNISVHEAIAHAAQVFEIQIQEKKANFNTQLEANDDVVKGDSHHFENILHCLFDNALKYCEGTPDILVSTRNIKTYICTEVIDKGIGIAEEDTQLVFEKFYRVSDKYRHDHKGFGLGLHYVKSVVEGMGGEVGVKSKLGQGAAFFVKIPLAKHTA